MKACQTPCIQQCYLRRQSDSGRALVADGARLAVQAGRRRLGGLSRHAETVAEGVLTLELTDVCPCGFPGCETPSHRFEALTRELSEAPDAASWPRLRDQGYLDFGRGFMGFEVVRRLVDDLRAARLRFEVLDLSWRGDPLLHPQIEPILAYLLDTMAAGQLAERLRLETTGVFLTENVAALSARPVPQEWVFDLDRGEGAGVGMLRAQRGPQTRLTLVRRALADRAPDEIIGSWPELARVAGRRPSEGDALWLRRTDHDHFQANARAREALARLASAAGVPAELGEEDRPRRCRAPAFTPTVSWDGKLTLCRWDRRLDNRVADLTETSLASWWRGPQRAADVKRCDSQGVPARALCASCPSPWSPNHP